MQIYPINNINNNPKFGALKGLRYVGEFNPSTNLEHAKIVKAVLDSKAIKQFGEKYNFLAKLKYTYLFDSITMKSLEYPYSYSLELIPAPVERPQEPRLTLWERIFGKKKNGTDAKAPVEEPPKEEEKIENLPLAFYVETIREDCNKDAINNFISKIRFTTLDELESSLQYKIADQKKEQLAEEARKKEHARILNEIKDAGF